MRFLDVVATCTAVVVFVVASPASASPDSASPVSATPAAPATPRGAGARLRVLVLDFEGQQVDAESRSGLVGLVAARIAQTPELDVVAGADLRRMVELEAEKQTVGCTASSCLAEIAGAMGAELVVFGDLSRVGSTMILNLNTYDAARAQSVGRVSVRGRDLDEIVAKLDPAVLELMRPTLVAHGIAAPGDGGGGVWTAIVLPAALVAAGVAAAGGGFAFDLLSPTSSNDEFDGEDLVGPALYGVAAIGVATGAGLLVLGAAAEDG